MAFIGMRHVVVAELDTHTDGSEPTYKAGMIAGKAIQGNLTKTFNDNPLPADDADAENDNSLLSMSLELGLDDLEEDAKVYMGLLKSTGSDNEKTYFEWMNNIQPWCISRQLWWGHQMPIWYGPDETIFCEETVEKAQEAADKHYGKHVELRRETDVLDTWFSSGLWAFSTLGWPENTEHLQTFYPTSVLVTGFDIIFFWVARMMMMSMYMMKRVPFKKCYIHGLVRDEQGRKMSKSKGNTVDPMETIEKYGADALRFFMASSEAQ